MENKEIYSHFIQKAIIKRWIVDDNKIHYTIYDNNDNHQIFKIDDPNEEQPVVEKGYYSYEIEKGMNDLESSGVNVINQILKHKNNVTITRKALGTIKFYFILNTIRTNLARKNIENLNGDYLFNEINKKENKSPKEIQELKMKIILEKYEDFKKSEEPGFILKEEANMMQLIEKNKGNFEKTISEVGKIFNIETFIKFQLNLIISSRLAFVKFTNGELLLTEAGTFQEISEKISPASKYDFFVISPEMGILIIKEPLIQRSLGILAEDSSIFNFDLKEKNITIYKKQLEIEWAQVKFLNEESKNIKNLEELYSKNLEFNFTEKLKFHTNKDEFKYKIHQEEKEVADMCNAMMLVHCKNSYIIYKNISTYYDAIKKSKERNIYRIEDQDHSFF